MKFKYVLQITVILPLLMGCDDSDDPMPPDGDNLVIITDESPASIQLDTIELLEIEIQGDGMSLRVSHSGGCAEHDYVLFMTPAAFLESLPVQANLYLQHEDNDDACDGLIDATITFDLRPIAALNQNFYGQKDEIILNVFDYFEMEPSSKLSISYFPE